MELVPIELANVITLQGDTHNQTWHVETVEKGENNTEKPLIIIANNDPSAFHQKTCGFEEDLYADGFRGYR